MKTKVIGAALGLILAATLSVAHAERVSDADSWTANAAVEQSGTLILDNNQTGQKLQSRIDTRFGTNYAELKCLIVRTGELTPEDCRFIRQNLTGLEELVIEGSANFTGGIIPKSAFEGLMSLRTFRADNATEIAMKAFSLCEGLESVDFPKVAKTGVQAFAQAKGSSAGRLRTARFPSLKQMDPRTFYYCTNLEALYLTAPPEALKPVGKEGLWFERVTRMVIHVPSRKVYEAFVKTENCTSLDWSAFGFTADNGDKLPEIQLAAEYDDAAYDFLRKELLPVFDKTGKDFSGEYYTGDFKWSLNMYTFNMNINAWMNDSSSTPRLSTLEAIQWAADAGFDAVDVTCYYIPGYSNTAMPTRPEKEILAYARQIRELCSKLGLEVSGTGLQNNFADPNRTRRETDVERIKFWIRVAHEMGAPVIRIFAGPPPADIRREGWEKIARERMVPHIREVAEYARTHYPDVRIGLQNHGGMLATANQVIQVLKWVDCDNVGIINDTGFYRDFMSTDATRYDWYRDIALVLPYSNNFQVKKKPAGAETQELMDLERLMRDIRKSPYRGYIPVELLWVGKDEGYPGKLKTPPYEETAAFIRKLKRAAEATRTPSSGSSVLRLEEPHGNILGLDPASKTITLLEKTASYQLREQLSLPPRTSIRVVDAQGSPRGDIEEIQDGDRLMIGDRGGKQDYGIRIKRYELVNLALNPSPERIKVSTFRGKTPLTKAFDGNSTGTSGSGYQVDGSQAGNAGKETFWLALDLGEQQTVNSFGVAWGTSVNNLKKRLKNGTYRVSYTNDPARWNALSHAETSGKGGLNNYAAPKGWTEVYSQNVDELPDANGNKVFIESLSEPVTARYVMVSGELARDFVEIYNFFVFRKDLIDGTSPQPEYPTFDLARIRPDYDGMAIMVGRPAIIRLQTPVPAYHITARQEITVSGKLIDPQGRLLHTFTPKHLHKGETHRVAANVIAGVPGTYKMEFLLDNGQPIYDTYCFTAVDEEVAQYTYAEPYPALRLHDGKLTYVPDYRGNTVIDYSNVGYRGGGVAIPNVPVKVVLKPSDDSDSDDTFRIQNAIDMLGRIEPDADGFRGAVLLKAGTFRVSESIRVDKSGIVIKGEGDGHESIADHPQPLSPKNWFDYAQSELPEAGITKVVATWIADSYNKNTAIFNFAGGGAEQTGNEVAITDQYVPAGTHTLRLEDVSGFHPGDNVRIKRSVNASWAQDLKMDVITDAPGVASKNQWATDGKLERSYTDIVQERTVASVDPRTSTITLVEPIVDPLDRKYGISTIARFEPTGRIHHAGIENIQLISRFDKSSTANNSAFGVDYKSYDNEYHAQVGVRIGNAENIWVRRITNYHIDVAVNVAGGSRWITVQDVNCLEPVSGTGGERRYSFTNSGGSLVLNQRNYVRYTRHGFIVMGNVMGPNVFYNDRSDYQFDANEPHLRWSAGGLFDNVKGRIYVQNRWNNGTAHGWSGANYTLYNNEGKFIVSQNPLAANYLFGQSDAADRLPFVMDEVDPGNVPNFKAYEYGIGRHMLPASLYIQQLHDRLGQQAVDNANDATIPAYIDESGNFYDKFAYLAGITVNGQKLPGFRKETLDYTVPVALDYTDLPKITARGEKGTTVAKSDKEKAVTFTVTESGKVTSTYTVNYGFVSKEPISSSGSAGQLEKLTDGNPKTQWSQPGSPHVQFYLGDKPVEIEKISLGYGRNTQIRRQYYFDFEISDDGYNWTKVSDDAWQQDNLGRGHIMGMQVMPGVGNSKSDYETFVFPKGVKARLLRVQMYGARNGRGVGSTNANAYWAIDVSVKPTR